MKTMLITGATSGIGLALTKLALNNDFRVIACGRNQQKLQQLAPHPALSLLLFDLTDEDSSQQKLANCKADIVVLNAGSCEYMDNGKIDNAMFKRVFAINFFAVINCVATLLPNIPTGGKLVFIDSLARLLPFSRTEAYGASKAALHYFAKSLRVDLAEQGIQVQTISPGFVKTPLTDKNNFSMPMMITAEQAARCIMQQIQSNKASGYFPQLFSWGLRILSLLPESIKYRICLRLKQSDGTTHKGQ